VNSARSCTALFVYKTIKYTLLTHSILSAPVSLSSHETNCVTTDLLAAYVGRVDPKVAKG